MNTISKRHIILGFLFLGFLGSSALSQDFRKLKSFDAALWSCRSSAEKNFLWNAWEDYVSDREGIYPDQRDDKRDFDVLLDRIAQTAALFLTGKDVSKNRARLRNEYQWIVAHPWSFDLADGTSWDDLIEYQHVGGALLLGLEAWNPENNILDEGEYGTLLATLRPYFNRMQNKSDLEGQNIHYLAWAGWAAIGMALEEDQKCLQKYDQMMAISILEPTDGEDAGTNAARNVEALGYSHMLQQAQLMIAYILDVNNQAGPGGTRLPILLRDVAENNEDAYRGRDNYIYDRKPFQESGVHAISPKRNAVSLALAEILLSGARPRLFNLDESRTEAKFQHRLFGLGLIQNALGDEAPGWIRWHLKKTFEKPTQDMIWTYAGGGGAAAVFIPTPRCLSADDSMALDSSSRWISGYEVFLSSTDDGNEYFGPDANSMATYINTASSNGKSMANQGCRSYAFPGWGGRTFSGNYSSDWGGTKHYTMVSYGDDDDSIPPDQEDHKGNRHAVPGENMIGGIQTTTAFSAATTSPARVKPDGYDYLAKPASLDWETAVVVRREIPSLPNDSAAMPYTISATRIINEDNKEYRIWDSIKRTEWHPDDSDLNPYFEDTSHRKNAWAGEDVRIHTEHSDRRNPERKRMWVAWMLNAGYFQYDSYFQFTREHLYRNRKQLKPGQTQRFIHVVQGAGTDVQGKSPSTFQLLPSSSDIAVVQETQASGDIRLTLIRFGEADKPERMPFDGNFAEMHGKYAVLAFGETASGVDLRAYGSISRFKVPDFGKNVQRVFLEDRELTNFRKEDGKIIYNPGLRNDDFFESQGQTCLVYNNVMAALCPDSITARTWSMFLHGVDRPLNVQTPQKPYGDGWPDGMHGGRHLPSFRKFMADNQPAITEGEDLLWAIEEPDLGLRWCRVVPAEGQTAVEKYQAEGGNLAYLYLFDQEWFARLSQLLPRGRDIADP